MIEVSYLQNIYTARSTGERCLHRSHITAFDSFVDWPDFVDRFAINGQFPQPPTGKADAYGWCATLFMPSGDEDEANQRNRSRPVIAHRAGVHAADHLTLFVADLDNHRPENPMITIDAVEAMLLEFDLPYYLYTSFSHRPDRHKVRIVIPVSRWLTCGEAFRVFLVLNSALAHQCDGSIYDPADFLYGPPLGADIRARLDGIALDVDFWLEQSDQLPEADRLISGQAPSETNKRPATDLEIAQFRARHACDLPTDGVSVNNPKFFNPEWFELADSLYRGGSHWGTMIGLLDKAWLKSQYGLSRADLETLQRELDLHWCGYLSRQYSRSELARAVRDVMKLVGTSSPASQPRPTNRELRAALKQMKKRKTETVR